MITSLKTKQEIYHHCMRIDYDFFLARQDNVSIQIEKIIPARQDV